MDKITFDFSNDGAGEATRVDGGCWEVNTPIGSFKFPFGVPDLKKRSHLRSQIISR